MTTTDQHDSSAHHVEQPVFSAPANKDNERAEDVLSTPRKLANPRRITFSHSAQQS